MATISTSAMLLVLPGVGIYDAISASEGAFIILIPFFLGRQYLSGPLDSLKVLQALVIAGLVYSLPMLFEVRFSPQLHYWVVWLLPQRLHPRHARRRLSSHGVHGARSACGIFYNDHCWWLPRRCGGLRAIPWKSLPPPVGVTFYLAGRIVFVQNVGGPRICRGAGSPRAIWLNPGFRFVSH